MSSDKILTGTKLVILILVTALLYFFAARIGLMLAMPPGFATAVWPPSGIAIAMVMLFGTRLWPGVFLGSFFANVLTSVGSLTTGIMVSSAIAAGSTMQTVIAVLLMHSIFTGSHLFSNYRNVFAFLFIAALSCFISPSIGAAVLYFADVLTWEHLPQNWLTWWLGDVAGVYLYAPFLIAWSVPFDWKQILQRGFEVCQLAALTIFLTLLCFGGYLSQGFPLTYLIVPCFLWAIFRFGAHGITAALVFVSIFAAWSTSHGYGAFTLPILTKAESLFILQVWLSIATVCSLMLLSLLNETRHVSKMLESYSIDLQNQVDRRTIELQQRTIQLQENSLKLQEKSLELQDRNQLLEKTLEEHNVLKKKVLSQEKMASLGSLVLEIGRQIKDPLNFVINFSETSQELLSDINELVTNKQLNEPEKLKQLSENLTSLKTHIEKIHTHGRGVHHIVEKMLSHASGSVGKIELVDFNGLVVEFTNMVIFQRRSQDPNLNIKLETSYDPAIHMVKLITQDFVRAFTNLLNFAIDSTLQKQPGAGKGFVPTLSIKTIDLGERVALILRDNGSGLSPKVQDTMFVPLYILKTENEAAAGLSVSYDLLVHHHGGEIKVESLKGEYTEFTVILPKHPEPKFKHSDV